MSTTNTLIFNAAGLPINRPAKLDLIIESAQLLQQQEDAPSLTEQIQAMANTFAQTNTIGIRFEKFTDGRPYSIAARLREAGFTGDLHAMGDINQEVIFILKRVGFTHFHIPDPGTPILAKDIVTPFAGHYQAAQDGSTAPWHTARLIDLQLHGSSSRVSDQRDSVKHAGNRNGAKEVAAITVE